MKTQTERPTPETDAKSRNVYSNNMLIAVGVVDSDFARHLERQRDELLETLEAVLPYAEEYQDCGPVGAGWKSRTVTENLDRAEKAIANVKKGEPKS